MTVLNIDSIKTLGHSIENFRYQIDVNWAVNAAVFVNNGFMDPQPIEWG